MILLERSYPECNTKKNLAADGQNSVVQNKQLNSFLLDVSSKDYFFKQTSLSGSYVIKINYFPVCFKLQTYISNLCILTLPNYFIFFAIYIIYLA